MGFLIDLLIVHPVLAVLQAAASILWPDEHPRAKRLQRYTAVLALLGVLAVAGGVSQGLLTGSVAVGVMGVILGYSLLVLAGRIGERIECRVWPGAMGQ